jgi:hypothetical protein
VRAAPCGARFLYPAARPAAGRTTLRRNGEHLTNLRMHDDPAPPISPPKREMLLRKRVAKFAEPGDAIVAWTQAWVSREGRLHALAARTYDFVVVTERELLLISTGFFSRRPRRLVYAAPLAVLDVVDSGGTPGHRLRVDRPRQKPLRIELRGDRHSFLVSTSLLSGTGVHDVETEAQ